MKHPKRFQSIQPQSSTDKGGTRLANRYKDAEETLLPPQDQIALKTQT